MSIPSDSMSFARLEPVDCKRIAKTSVEYCLFWLTEASGLWMRFSNQAKIGIVRPISSAIDTRDEKFSMTPENGKRAWATVLME